MIIGIIGELGIGKTMSGVKETHKAYKSNLTIFSNHPLAFPHIKITHPDQFEDIKNGFCFADELWHLLDSYNSNTERAKFITRILLRSRKKDIHLCYTEQYLKQVHKRIRRVTDIWIYPEIRGVYVAGKLQVKYPFYMIQHFIDNNGDEVATKIIQKSSLLFYMSLYNTNDDPYTYALFSSKKDKN